MVFKRLFNWLKLKTLPSSVLFKNRLFIERDSKHRRVMTNWGLTFRNSKWTNYSLSNVSTRSVTLFTKLIAWTIFAIWCFIAIKHQTNFYLVDLTNNTLTYSYWSLKAQVSHLFFLAFWGIHFIMNTIFNSVFRWYINHFFGITLKPSGTQNEAPSTFNDRKKASTRYKESSTSDETLDLLQNVFEDSKANTLGKSKENLETVLLLKHLYKTVYLISLYNSTWVTFSKFSSKDVIGSEKSSFYDTYEQKFLTPNVRWTLDSNHTKLHTNRTSIEREGLFYSTDLNYRSLNTDFNHLSTSTASIDLQNQMSMVGVQRFMFKYNPLHRHVMKGSLNLTATKKLLAPYSKNSALSLKKTNIWLSSKNSHKSNFDINQLVKVSNSVEDSYFFTLKRYAMFDKLSANQILTKYSRIDSNQLSTSLESNLYNNTSSIYDVLLTRLVNKSLISKFDLLTFNSFSSLKLNQLNDFSFIDSQVNFQSDIIISLDDQTFFNNDSSLFSSEDQLNGGKVQLNLFNLVNYDKNLSIDTCNQALTFKKLLNDKSFVSQPCVWKHPLS